MSPAQQIGSKRKRIYSYGYPDYSNLLKDIHDGITTQMKAYQMQENARELQTILSEIKLVSSALAKNSKKIINQALRAKYEDFINEIAETQAQLRKSQGLHGGGGQKIFAKRNRDENFRNKQVLEGADEILEETLGVMFAVIQKRLSGKSYSIQLSDVQQFFGGQEKASTGAARAFENDLSQGISDGLKEGLEKATGQIIKIPQQLKAEKSQKSDINGFTQEVVFYIDPSNLHLAKLGELLKDATFTAKNYSSWGTRNGKSVQKSYEKLDLHLGRTNLFKPVTGAIERTISREVISQRDMFYRGLQTIIKANNPSSDAIEVQMHFTHMRFAFELAGYGLTDQWGKPLFAKYLIYNDPTGDAIFVRDTASLIIEEFENGASAANLFSEMMLSASRANSLI